MFLSKLKKVSWKLACLSAGCLLVSGLGFADVTLRSDYLAAGEVGRYEIFLSKFPIGYDSNIEARYLESGISCEFDKFGRSGSCQEVGEFAQDVTITWLEDAKNDDSLRLYSIKKQQSQNDKVSLNLVVKYAQEVGQNTYAKLIIKEGGEITNIIPLYFDMGR